MSILPSMICKHIPTILNISVVLFTFVESYYFPFAIIKWMIVVTKYGGLIKFLSSPNITGNSELPHLKYKYQLQLKTSSTNITKDENVSLESYVSLIIDSGRIQLSYCGQECKRIPPALQTMYGPKVKCLDLSYNSLETLKGLEKFVRLEELILDNNQLGDTVSFPKLPYLRTLSLNNNQITDLEELVNKISEHFPMLTYLSILSNKACPNQLSDIDKDDSDYQRYRYFVVYKLPNLMFLDSRRVSSSERREAATRGEFMRVRRPPPLAPVAPPPYAPTTVDQPRPLPLDLASLGKHKGAYGKCHYKYTGKHSEGNRFILNSDL